MKLWSKFALMALALFAFAVGIVVAGPWEAAHATQALHAVWAFEGAAVFFFLLAIFIGWLEKKEVQK